MIKTIKPFLTSWSYIINQNGNAIRTTLEGQGSCTSINKLQEWIDNLPQKELEKLADECDERKDKVD